MDYQQARTYLLSKPEAFILRDIFEGVIPGYHMSKVHWNTVILDSDVPSGEIERMMDSSYTLIVKSLKKREREALLLAYGEAEVFG